MDGKSSDMAQRHGKYLFGEWRTAWGVPPVGNGKGHDFAETAVLKPTKETPLTNHSTAGARPERG